MMSGHNKEAWGRILWWYRKVKVHKATPSREGLNQIYADMEDLYRFRTPYGRRVPVLVKKGEVDGGVPEETEIVEATRGLQGGKSGGQSGMRVEDLKGWLREETRKKNR